MMAARLIMAVVVAAWLMQEPLSASGVQNDLRVFLCDVSTLTCGNMYSGSSLKEAT
jgi:hypothetical protein